MDFCRSIWWICAGGSPDFLTDRCPELLVSTDGIHETRSHDSHQSPISDCSDIWSLVFTWSIQSMPSFHSKIIAGVIFIWTAGTIKSCAALMNVMVLIGGNQFPIMITLSCDGSEQGSSGLRNWPNFLRYFQSVAPIWSGGWGADRSSRATIKQLNRWSWPWPVVKI